MEKEISATIIQIITEQIRQNGISLVLVCLAVWYLHGRQEMLETKVDDCNAEVIRILTEDRVDLKNVIQEHTKIMNKYYQTVD